MTFNPNIPGANDFISTSQNQIQINFSQANTIFDLDHVTFDNATTANRGKHRKSTYIEVTDPNTSADEIAVYAKAVSGVTRLFIRQENNGTIFQLTGPDPSVGASGSTFLPGGLILKYGQATIGAGTSSVAVSFGTAFPTNGLSVTATPLSASAGLVTGNYPGIDGLTTSGFNINRNGSGGSLTYYYFAIGN